MLEPSKKMISYRYRLTGRADHNDFADQVELNRAFGTQTAKMGKAANHHVAHTEGNERIMTDPRAKLLTVFKERAVSFGKFTLASGKESTYYINSKKAIFYSEAVWLLGEVLWEMTRDLHIDAAGGLEVGAIPMAAALAQRYHQGGRSLEGFFVRKQAKAHGSQERVEGVLRAGMRVAVLDDVLTTGGSVLQAIGEIEKIGAKVAAVVCIVDRLEGAREALAKYPYRPIFTIRDLGIG
jgi:orotate phosphoribosyltransferase